MPDARPALDGANFDMTDEIRGLRGAAAHVVALGTNDAGWVTMAKDGEEYELRLAVRPGVTGWAQTRYLYANNLEQETEKVRYDLYYVKHMSAWLDLRILFDTIKVVLLGRRSDMTSPVSDPAQEGPRVRDTAA